MALWMWTVLALSLVAINMRTGTFESLRGDGKVTRTYIARLPPLRYYEAHYPPFQQQHEVPHKAGDVMLIPFLFLVVFMIAVVRYVLRIEPNSTPSSVISFLKRPAQQSPAASTSER